MWPVSDQIISYTVVSNHNNLEKMIQEVRSLIDDKWYPFGNMVAESFTHPPGEAGDEQFNGCVYHQPMVRYRKDFPNVHPR